MRRVVQRSVLAVGTTVLALVFLGSLPRGVQAQPPRPPTPVQIVDPIPLPVNGAVTITGAPAVTVTNTAATPFFVRAADNPAAQPVVIDFDQDMANGIAQTVCPVSAYTVPAGKTLVVEYANFFGIGEPLEPVETLGFAVDTGAFVQYTYVAAHVGTTQASAPLYTHSEQVRYYFGPSSSVGICAFRGDVATGVMTARAKLTGYLVDTP